MYLTIQRQFFILNNTVCCNPSIYWSSASKALSVLPSKKQRNVLYSYSRTTMGGWGLGVNQSLLFLNSYCPTSQENWSGFLYFSLVFNFLIVVVFHFGAIAGPHVVCPSASVFNRRSTT